MRKSILSLSLLAWLLTTPATFAASAPAHLLHSPALNRSQIVFSYAGDLWTVNRAGGTAARLTSGAGIETLPIFSPDGGTLAFTGEYDGNVDVYTLPAAGGVPKRITYHPGADYAAGWSPDGQRILFRSNRQSFSRYTQLFSVAKDGGLADALPLPMSFSGCTRRTEGGSRTRRSMEVNSAAHPSGGWLGGGTGVAKRAICRSQIWPISAPRKFLAPIPTTSTRCGSAIRSTFSPTAAGP